VVCYLRWVGKSLRSNAASLSRSRHLLRFRLFARAIPRSANGIFFNYESPLRSTEFVTRKITSGVAAFVVHDRYPLCLGNLAAKRDWGSAKEYVDGMWRILHAPSPEAFVLASGRTETIKTFVDIAYATQGIQLEFRVPSGMRLEFGVAHSPVT
jgi:GDP-mannose 4,6-dehydratase